MSKVKYTKDDCVKFPSNKLAEAVLVDAGWKKDTPKKMTLKTKEAK